MGKIFGNIFTALIVIAFAWLFVRFAETSWTNAPAPIRDESHSSSDPIDMLEPHGIPDRDEQNSGTNIQNAQAEVYRAQAELLYQQAKDLESRAILYPAEAEVLLAQAYKLRVEADATMLLAQAEYSKSPAGGVAIFKDGMNTGVTTGRTIALRDVALAIMGLVVLILLFFKKKGS